VKNRSSARSAATGESRFYESASAYYIKGRKLMENFQLEIMISHDLTVSNISNHFDKLVLAQSKFVKGPFCVHLTDHYFRFTQPANLRTHMKKKHDTASIKNNKCPHCQVRLKVARAGDRTRDLLLVVHYILWLTPSPLRNRVQLQTVGQT
jgi:hypothetical protein